MKKEYLIIGSDNFWYASCLTSMKQVKEEIKRIQKNPNHYGEPLGGPTREYIPDTLYVYKAEEVMRVENEDEEDDLEFNDHTSKSTPTLSSKSSSLKL